MYNASAQIAIMINPIGHVIAAIAVPSTHNQATIVGIANHNSQMVVIRPATAATTKNIFFAFSGLSFARPVILSSIGNTFSTAFVNISSSHHSTTSPFANHQREASAIPTLSFNVLITPQNVLLFLSIIPKNKPPSVVASLMVS